MYSPFNRFESNISFGVRFDVFIFLWIFFAISLHPFFFLSFSLSLFLCNNVTELPFQFIHQEHFLCICEGLIDYRLPYWIIVTKLLVLDNQAHCKHHESVCAMCTSTEKLYAYIHVVCSLLNVVAIGNSMLLSS